MWYRQSYVSEVRSVSRFHISRISVVLKVVIMHICRNAPMKEFSYPINPEFHIINWSHTNHLRSEDNYRTSCRNVSHFQLVLFSFVHPDDPAPCTYEMTPVFKPFLVSCSVDCEWELEYKCDLKLSSVFTAPTGFYDILDPNEGIAFFSSGRPSQVQPFLCS